MAEITQRVQAGNLRRLERGQLPDFQGEVGPLLAVSWVFMEVGQGFTK